MDRFNFRVIFDLLGYFELKIPVSDNIQLFKFDSGLF